MSDVLQISVQHPGKIDAETLSEWQALCTSNPLYSRPLLAPEFAQMIGAVRSDTQTIIARENGKLVACLTVHVRKRGLTRPVGTPFDDYSGPVLARGSTLSADDLIKAAGFHSYRANSALVQPHSTTLLSERASYFSIALGKHSPKDYLEDRRARYPKRFKNLRRLRRKLENEKGVVTFAWGTPAPENLDLLLKWKSDQFQSEGLLDLTKASSSKIILKAAAKTVAQTQADFGSFMTELHVNGTLVAGHFGIRKGAHFHPWISAFDRDFTLYMPGILLLQSAVLAMQDMQLESYSLSGGHDHYKKYFAEPRCQVHAIHYADASHLGIFQRYSYNAWDLLGAKNTTSIAARMRRRLDHIACCEMGMLDRVKEFGVAVAKRH